MLKGYRTLPRVSLKAGSINLSSLGPDHSIGDEGIKRKKPPLAGAGNDKGDSKRVATR
jgi:hypothetical protein